MRQKTIHQMDIGTCKCFVKIKQKSNNKHVVITTSTTTTAAVAATNKTSANRESSEIENCMPISHTCISGDSE